MIYTTNAIESVNMGLCKIAKDRGDRIRPDHRSKQYVVDDWRGHGLRRPPSGYQWVQYGGDYLLVAVTTGIILKLLLNR